MTSAEKVFLVDSHAHWDFKEFEGEQEALWQRCQEAGVGGVLAISTHPDRWEKVLKVADAFEKIYATLGVHPCDSGGLSSEGLRTRFLKGATHPKVVGLGETGLDFFHEPFDRKHQESMLHEHVVAGLEVDLPLVIHSRQAAKATLEFLENPARQGLKAVMHCFAGSKEFAKACLDLGFYISFSGIVTFKNAKELQDVARFVPLDRLLVETDAPYLAPHPFRGQRNESSYVRLVAEKIAELKGIGFDEVAARTTENFFTLFKKAQKPCD